MVLQKISYAPTIWNQLNGIINVYKPCGVKLSHVRKTIISNICRDLNNLNVRPPRLRVNIEHATSSGYKIKVEEDLADNILVAGERYDIDHIKCGPAATLGTLSSGVLILGINKGLKLTTKIHRNRPIRVYHITGCLGKSTSTNFPDSYVTNRASFNHVSLEKINQLMSSLQASHQKKMFEECGIDLNSQAAYDLAIKGTIRPNSFKIPVLYGLKCIEYKKPEFTLEIHALNENEEYFGILIHEIGLQLHSVAYCTKIRCIRHGPFHLENSLLRHNWDLQQFMNNMNECNRIIQNHPNLIKNQFSELVQ